MQLSPWAVGCFSFNANKIITTGGGGMLVTQSASIAKKAKHLSMQAKKNSFFWEHDDIGYNYRLPNISATIGIFQMKRINSILIKKKYMNGYYQKIFKNDSLFNLVETNLLHNKWMNLLKIKSNKNILKKLLIYLNRKKIEVRPVWKLLHEQKKFKNFEKFKIIKAKKLIEKHICLPSGIDLNKKKLTIVFECIKEFQKSYLK